MSEVCFTDPETIQQLVLEDEELRYLDLQEQKVPNWEMCGKTFLNPLYASGKRYKFRLKCGNTRKCARCRNDMIEKLEREMQVGVPLYCHLISDEENVWNSWKMWFSRNRSDLDRYWRYPLKDGSFMVVSTLKRYKDVPILQNPERQIREWVNNRGDTGKVTRSEKAVNCAKCKCLFLPRKKFCPECGTEYQIDYSSKPKEKTIAIPHLTDIEQEFFDDLISEGAFSDSLWDNSEKRLGGLSMERYISDLVLKAQKMARKKRVIHEPNK